MKLRMKAKVIVSLILAVMLVIVPFPVSASASDTATSLIQVKTPAGTGDPGYNDGIANQALFNNPCGLAISKYGGLIIVDSYNNRIRLLNNKKVTTLAGTSDITDVYGYPLGGYVDGAVHSAKFNHPRGVAVDSKGNIYISDSGNHCIRIIAGKKVYTFAGTDESGYVNEKSGKARFNLPSGMAIDKNDNLYVADTLNHVIRKITPKGEVTTFAGKYSETGGYKDGAALQAQFNEPSDVAVDGSGTVYVLDSGNQLVRKIKDGVVSTLAGTRSGKIANTTYAKGGFQNGAWKKARFNFPMGIEVTEDGTIFIADTWNYRIRIIQQEKSVGTLAGSGISGWFDTFADEAQFNGPADVLYYKGTLYISDMWNNCIRSMSINLKKVGAVVDRSDVEASYQLSNTSDETQLWYEGKQLKLTDAKPYIEDKKVYLPLEAVLKAWGATVKWNQSKDKLSVTKDGFRKTFLPGKDNSFLKQGVIYIDLDNLVKLTKLRVIYFQAYNSVVIEERGK